MSIRAFSLTYKIPRLRPHGLMVKAPFLYIFEQLNVYEDMRRLRVRVSLGA